MFESFATRVRTSPAEATALDGPRKHTQQPIVTGTSIIAVKYKDGVIMAGDTLGSYGSLARFTGVKRITKIGSTLVGADGDYSDFQFISKFLDEMETEEKCVDDGITYSANEIAHRLTSLLYFRRSKINPLWNNLVIAGVSEENGQLVPFLSTTDKIGTAYEADYIATGFGLHLATPILYDKWKPDMTEDEARELVGDCLRVCFYRDCRTINNITFAKASYKQADIEEPTQLVEKWDYSLFVDVNAGTKGPR
mmetsp:Transcript_5593/g.7085  ORF Transcript_5593/g.7085 Transcript_5593/m.7085 type:complete len:252 (+) Transcript_5593:220-975(+)|eukprot:CAMPEP_0204831646 /NCGR_PEP_ID=MMETSP1346-20131115/11082_1 /ASSEMBLY_ACC=CAM_ASM_000771 /TAXON_ID=215587 /ORGANISM="Aplanochytrium stocchinoi, Strain GSBS06" /LENGTH=251 /DNA_ID=CAMNT_0051962821 /DNA_START=195 /DNA_END=950 /DNA_ORIENTATION=-